MSVYAFPCWRKLHPMHFQPILSTVPDALTLISCLLRTYWGFPGGVSEIGSWLHFWRACWQTSNGRTRLVQPGGTFIGSVFFFCRSFFTSFVCWARWTSATKILLDEPDRGGFVNTFPHSCSTQTFITLSSRLGLEHHIYSAIPATLFIGLTLGTPSAKIVSCAVHCRLLI